MTPPLAPSEGSRRGARGGRRPVARRRRDGRDRDPAAGAEPGRAAPRRRRSARAVDRRQRRADRAAGGAGRRGASASSARRRGRSRRRRCGGCSASPPARSSPAASFHGVLGAHLASKVTAGAARRRDLVLDAELTARDRRHVLVRRRRRARRRRRRVVALTRCERRRRAGLGSAPAAAVVQPAPVRLVRRPLLRRVRRPGHAATGGLVRHGGARRSLASTSSGAGPVVPDAGAVGSGAAPSPDSWVRSSTSSGCSRNTSSPFLRPMCLEGRRDRPAAASPWRCPPHLIGSPLWTPAAIWLQRPVNGR